MAHREQVFAAREQFDRMQLWRVEREDLQARSATSRQPLV
jgi:hypothetical protein